MSEGRSGYAADVLGTADDAGTLPQRVGGGFSAKQKGRLLPTERKYKPGTHKIVTADEAQVNMMKRARGEMPPIAGGSDDPMAFEDDIPNQPQGDIKVVSVELPKGEAYDPLGEVNIDPQPGDAELEAEEKALAANEATILKILEQHKPKLMESSRTVTKQSESALPAPDFPEREESKTDAYLKQRKRIGMELSDGTMHMTVTDVIPSKYGVTILLPLSDDSVTFIPKPGSEICIMSGDKSWDCYFPGITFELPELSSMGMVFVRSNEDMA